MSISANRFSLSAAICAAVLALGACASARPAGVSNDPRFQMGDAGAIARARADSLRYPYTKADIDFMSGMIHHHAQAITISRWAPTHGATASVQRLTARIINAQTDEIMIMQTWLKDRLQPIPVVDSLGQVTMQGGMAGMSHDAHAGHGGGTNAHGQMEMPGMLTAAQLAELDASRGADFDRLFLTFMIQHHRGAVTMVKSLFTAPGAGQDETIFKFANDVEVDQGTEIKRMMSMMLDMGFVPPSE
ncbi:MAG TPA: DUF305 domain-containing protein [Gemmatimonas sp.]|uniref:DUF305 domain-containing protein n=1 Tax=Gemmatimonas sp. TaxID=1962908 RepID=UPI002ED7B57C